MHTIFSVAAKLLGVYFAFLGLIYLVNVLLVGDGGGAAMLVQLLHAALAFVFAFVLVRRTDRLARLLGVSPEAQASAGGLEPRTALRTGIVLVGLFVFLTRLESALRMAWIDGAPAPIAIEAVPLALAVFFVFRADRVVGWITREKTPAL